ncbi:STAS domain-containing protein [Calidifontibacillus erzurumensis]|uniref:STAS domain-containing protein n=1 Tax=Calidifontibacillus erzurumensis TaxID=2741433 RepID=A0A8J8KBQ6_9BACI|nr:STAS domain-containing protein [Calidifontibacillus erzurumensis]NSL51862.1 STAS domain-containing protein [Calidifontibacillus erzurumensis]
MEAELIISLNDHKDVCLLQLTGDLTKTSGEKLLKYYDWENGLPNDKNILVVDFTKVNYINSAGIAYLFRMSKLLHEKQVSIRTFGLEYHYEKMFQIVGLTKFLKNYPSEWAAIEDW